MSPVPDREGASVGAPVKANHAAPVARPAEAPRTQRSPWWRRALLGAVVVGVVGAAGWFGVQRALGPKVEVVVATRADVVQTVVSSGRVLAPAEVSLGGLLAGVVRVVHPREGDRVRAGQVLVEFDDAELAAQVAQARAGVLVAASRVGQVRGTTSLVAQESLRQAQANLRVAQATFARQQDLYRSGAISQSDLESAQRSLDVAQSQVHAAQFTAEGSSAGGTDARAAVAARIQAEAALRVAEARLAQTRIVAPADGVIMQRAVEPGDVVAPTRALLVLLEDGRTELSVTPDERNLADLRLGQHALASAEAFPDRPFPAEVTYIAPTIDALRGTVEVKLLVATPPAYLRPAMTVSVEVEVGRSLHALTLPAEAVRDAGTHAPWVMVVDAAGHTARRAVRLGLHGDAVIEVLDGVREGERVVPANAAMAVPVGRHVRATPRAATADAGRP